MALPPRGSRLQPKGPVRRGGASAHESSHRGLAPWQSPPRRRRGDDAIPTTTKNKNVQRSYMARAGPGGGGNSGRAPAHTLCGLAALLDEVPDVAAHLHLRRERLDLGLQVLLAEINSFW